jgi:hypothetical protein
MYTVLAFSVSHDPAGVFTALTPAADESVRVNGNGFIVPANFTKLVGAYAALGANAAQARILAPSLRTISPEYITPIEGALIPTTDLFTTVSPNKVLQLEASEQLEVHENSNPAAAEQHTAVLFLADQEPAEVKGAIRTIYGTITLAQVAGTWSGSVITLNDNLPPGDYKIVGLRVEGAGMIVARLVIPGMANRPGAICAQSNIVQRESPFRHGKMGVMGSFNTTNLFNVEVLCSAAVASATYNCMIDILK